MVHAARGPMAHVCHDLRQARVPKALGDGGGRAWSTPPHLWQLFGFPLGSAQCCTPANIALFDKHLECLEKRPLNRLTAVCTATPLDVSKNSMQKPRTDIGIHHKFLDRPQHPLVPCPGLAYHRLSVSHLSPQRHLRMAKLTKTQAARQLNISRTTLYKLIDEGKLSATPDGLIDTAELVRVMSTLDVQGERPRTPLDTIPLDTAIQANEHRERPVDTSSERPLWTSSERQLTSSYEHLVDILREQLQMLREELQEARTAAQERERNYREHIARLTTMLDQAHQQNQRLLDL